jgi:alkanesulfonate monooxygenase SsuD/methylene tetrahydromethanopterin reductase-like flavin-dependent oxidoreductase (luciferase family)
MLIQNLDGHHTDREVYQHVLGMADLAEPLGFDSIWIPEHHFTDYTMTPNVAQLLTYLAGRTQRVKLGAMAYIVPWHEPIRLAEEISVLDHTSNGRAIVGFGRGLGRVEFDAFRLNMNESRERFIEYTEAVLKALETGYIEYDGKYYKQPRRSVSLVPWPSLCCGGIARIRTDHGAARAWHPHHRPKAVGYYQGRAGDVPRSVP